MKTYNYPQACTGTTLSSFFRLLIKVILALYTLYAVGIRLFTSNPFLGADMFYRHIFHLHPLPARRSSTMGTGKGFFSFLEYCRGKSAFCGTSFPMVSAPWQNLSGWILIVTGTLIVLLPCCLKRQNQKATTTTIKYLLYIYIYIYNRKFKG